MYDVRCFGYDPYNAQGESEIVKVKSVTGTSLTGFQQVVLTTDVDKTVHNFRIVEKYRSKTSRFDGAIYDFYRIDRHYTIVDKTPAVYEALAATNAALDDVIISMLKEG